jgi:hypothetical protein
MNVVSSITLRVVELGAGPPGDGQLPVPPVLHSNHTAALAMVIALYAGFAAAVVFSIAKLARGEVLPVVLLVAGFITCHIEPLGDHMGFIVYAPDIPWFHWWEMGRQMPSFIFVGLVAYLVFGGYFAYRLVDRGASIARVAFISAVVVGIPEIVMEMLWHHWGIISYYGDNPTRILGVPLYTIVQNSALLPVLGVTVFVGVRYLLGARLLWLIPAIPGVTIGYIVGTTWVAYQAIGSSAPAAVVWSGAFYSCVTALAAAYGVLQLPIVRERRTTSCVAHSAEHPDAAGPVAVSEEAAH